MARAPRISTRIRVGAPRARLPDFSGVAASSAEPFGVLSDGFGDIPDDFFSMAKAFSRNKPKDDSTTTGDTDGNEATSSSSGKLASARQFASGGSGGGRERATSAAPDENASAFERFAGPFIGADAPTEQHLLNSAVTLANAVKQTQAQHMLNAYGPVLDQALAGFRGLTGLEAINAWGKTRDDMRKAAAELLSTVTDEDVRRMAEPPIMRAVEEKVAEADLHVLSARQEFADEVFDRTQASLQKSAMEDPARAPDRAEEAATSTFEHVLARTGDEAAAEQAARLARIGINAMAISVLTDRGQVGEARTYFEAVKEEIDPDNTLRLERLLEEGEFRQNVDEVVADILIPGRSEDEALQSVSELPDGCARDMTSRKVVAHYQQQRELTKREARDRFRTLEQVARKGGGLAPSDVVELSDHERRYFEQLSEQARLKAIDTGYRSPGDGGQSWVAFYDLSLNEDALAHLTLDELKRRFELGVTEAEWESTVLPRWKAVRIAAGKAAPSADDPLPMDWRRIDHFATQAGIDARAMPGSYTRFLAEYNQRVAVENAITIQAKRLILQDMAAGWKNLAGGGGGDILLGASGSDDELDVWRSPPDPGGWTQKEIEDAFRQAEQAASDQAGRQAPMEIPWALKNYFVSGWRSLQQIDLPDLFQYIIENPDNQDVIAATGPLGGGASAAARGFRSVLSSIRAWALRRSARDRQAPSRVERSSGKQESPVSSNGTRDLVSIPEPADNDTSLSEANDDEWDHPLRLIENLTPQPGRRRRNKNLDKPGDYSDALRDFDILQPKNVEMRPDGGKMGDLPNGRRVIVRPKSGEEGPPTLEIQSRSRKRKDKVRYDK